MLIIIALIGLAFLAGREHSGIGVAAVVFIALVRYGYGLTLDQLPLKRERNPWSSAATPPDDGLTVLLALSDGEVSPGYRDGDLWRDMAAYPIEAARVVCWMRMPRSPVTL